MPRRIPTEMTWHPERLIEFKRLAFVEHWFCYDLAKEFNVSDQTAANIRRRLDPERENYIPKPRNISNKAVGFDKSKEAMRTCLFFPRDWWEGVCGNVFLSNHPGHRKCPRCRTVDRTAEDRHVAI